MDLGLRGKSAVVTGASKGIGRAIALRLADEGAGVAICARSEPALRQTEAELRTRSVPVYAAVCDVAIPEALDGFLDAARANVGQIDILVNNPSGFAFADDQAAWDSTLAVDLMAAVHATTKVAAWMAGYGGGAELPGEGDRGRHHPGDRPSPHLRPGRAIAAHAAGPPRSRPGRSPAHPAPGAVPDHRDRDLSGPR